LDSSHLLGAVLVVVTLIFPLAVAITIVVSALAAGWDWPAAGVGPMYCTLAAESAEAYLSAIAMKSAIVFGSVLWRLCFNRVPSLHPSVK
jgi:hypothetical protein